MKSAILLAVLCALGEYENCAQHLKNGAAMIFDVGVRRPVDPARGVDEAACVARGSLKSGGFD